jgi:hypothetical protein
MLLFLDCQDGNGGVTPALFQVPDWLAGQKALGNPAWRKIEFAVWRLTTPTGTGKFRPVIGLLQIS